MNNGLTMNIMLLLTSIHTHVPRLITLNAKRSNEDPRFKLDMEWDLCRSFVVCRSFESFINDKTKTYVKCGSVLSTCCSDLKLDPVPF